MRRGLMIAAVAALLVVTAVPALADSATVTHREGTFGGEVTVSLCNGDEVYFAGDWHYRWTSVINENGRHYTQLTMSDGPRFGVSTITGQTYKMMSQSPITSQSLDNGQRLDWIMFANTHYVAQGDGPEHGIVQLRHARFVSNGSEASDHFFSICKSD